MTVVDIVLLALALALAVALAWRPMLDRHGAAYAAAGLPHQPASEGLISFDGLVRHFLATGVVRPRQDDQLPFDQPLAPDAPRPKLVPLRTVVARLPTFAVAAGD